MVIIAAVDRTDRATDVIREVEPLAQAFDETVHVVHVLTTSDYVGLERTSVEETGAGIDMDRVREIAADIAAEAAAELDVPMEAIGLVGNPASQVVSYTAEQNARYIVTAGRKRSPTGKAVFGSVAQSILMNAECPVVLSIEQ